jgi:MinD-like ATPase involved in chromosome partitioning or flagellar assembly
MGILAVAGDGATTTSVALTAGWPGDQPPVLIEADPSGGDLAAWLDVPPEPCLTDCVARMAAGGDPDLDRIARSSPGGLRYLPAAPRAVEAARAVSEAGRGLVGRLAGVGSTVAIADVGRLDDRALANPFVSAAELILVVHRQSQQSAAAAAVRLRRLADDVAALGSRAAGRRIVAVVGGRPFGADEIHRMFSDSGDPLPVIVLPDDALAAAVFGGRAGVSTRRLARLPLSRAGAALASSLAAMLATPHEGVDGR